MKKTYIIPQTRVTRIQLQQMIAQSGARHLMDSSTPADAGGEVLSRRRNEWDDEEEEDF